MPANKDELTNTNETIPIVNWKDFTLEDTWPDCIDLKSITGILSIIRSVLGKRKPVTLPDSILQSYSIPKYALQEFHNLPNGNYSRHFSRGYITGFDHLMLGHVDKARNWIAEKLKNCHAVVDVGTAGGKTAATVKSAGVKKVWGIDPSPYLLKHAAKDYPDIEFLQGIAEKLPFSKNSIDGISVCFVFHELPPKYLKQALHKFHQCLAPGGLIAISEPSEQQLYPFKWRDFFKTSGWLKLYFRTLANFVYEPFLEAWHKIDKTTLASECGFKLKDQKLGMPINLFLLEKARH